LSSPFFKKEIKKFLREKTLIKNFFKYKKGVSHYHFGAKAHSEMIVYTFLLPCKNERGKMAPLFSGTGPGRSGIDINCISLEGHNLNSKYKTPVIGCNIVHPVIVKPTGLSS
jgi:hypothetical protein